MQPVLAIVTGAFAFGTTVWVVYRFVRSVFPAASPNLLGAGLVAAAIWLLVFRLFAVALFLLVMGANMLAPGYAARPRNTTPRTSRVPSDDRSLKLTAPTRSGTIMWTDAPRIAGPRRPIRTT